MRYIICGVGKIQNDFEYIFPEMKPEYYIWTESSQQYSDDLVVYGYEKLEEETGDFYVIICDREKEVCAGELERHGLKYGEKYGYADDYFSKLDYPLKEKVRNRKVVVWGTGGASAVALQEMEKKGISTDHIAFYLDNSESKIGTEINGIEVKSVEDCDLSDCFVIVASEFYREIRWQLIDRGRVENEDFVFYQKLCLHESEMLKKTIYDVPVRGNDCFWPFEEVNIQPYGVIPCGWPSWLSTPIGYADADDLPAIWNSNVAKIIRLSMLNHTYSFCDESVCPYLDLVPNYEEEFVFDRNTGYAKKMPEYPKVCGCSFDVCCNLKCPSCRREGIYKHSENTERTLEDISNKLIDSGWWEKVSNIAVAGNGEVFYSKHYKKLILDTDIKRENMMIQTNGTLVKEEYLEEISKKYKYIDFYISIDAASKETFEKLRTGSWKALNQGLSLISRFRKEGKIDRVRLSFVVQRENYREMIDFIKMAKKYGFDWIYFSRIQNFTGLDDDYFWDSLSMINRDGTMREELIDVFRDPLINEDIVDVRQFYRNLELSGMGDLIKNKRETVFYGNAE